MSPVRESQPLHWFVRDIDIGDPPLDTRSDCGPGDTRYVPHHLLRPPHHSLLLIFSKKKQPHYMLPLQRTRSRHDCNFIPGSPFLNAGNFLLHQIFPLKTFCFNRYHSFSSFLLLHDVVVEVAELSQRIFFEQSTMKQKFEISVTKLQKVRTSHSFSVEPANIRRPLKAEKFLQI